MESNVTVKSTKYWYIYLLTEYLHTPHILLLKKKNSIQDLQCLRLPSFLDSLLDPLYNHTNMIPFRRL